MPFKRDLSAYRVQLERDGFILLKDVLSDSFMKSLLGFLDDSRAGRLPAHDKWKIGGKKEQFLYDFPNRDIAGRFRAGIAALTGMAENKMTISERHLKQYDLDAPDYPAPHKDRGASKYSIGLPLYLGPGTSACVFPDLDRSPNMSERAVFMSQKDHSGLEALYKSREVLPLNEELGDMIVFLGSAIYHERIRPRGTAVLYIKMNDQGFDPLGENIYAPETAAEPA